MKKEQSQISLSSFTPMYTSQVAFGNLELSLDIKKHKIVLMGVPFDAAVSNRPGTRMAPRQIRVASSMIQSNRPYGWKSNDKINEYVVDFGDLLLDYGAPHLIYEQIEKHITPIVDQDKKIIAIGGDHSISYAFIKKYAQKYGRPISLLQFDSHTDTWSDGQIKRIDHGSMFYHAVKDGYIDAKSSVQLGIRTDNEDTLGVNIFDNDYIHRHGFEKTIEETKKILGNNITYLSFDIDFLDPAFAPGTGTPVCGGFSSWQAMKMLMLLKNINFCAMDLVEVSPPYDNSDITALCAANIIMHMMFLLK